ncbi:MAG: redox-sensing transcriptional repressor Rex [Oscillospiraceae bacterium]|nr:redox-sensing transcriptional repressor Rex [Oscillospiraceae bacterium]
MMQKNVPEVVARRLPRYYRYLGELLEKNIMQISSNALSRKMNVTASQIRQDLNCFGGFGHQGYGYDVKELHSFIGEILGLGNHYHMIIIGAGNVGRAVANYPGFKRRGFVIEAIFDVKHELLGTEINGIPVLDSAGLADYCREHHPHIAAIATPKTAAPDLVKTLEESGIKGIWNFSHVDFECSIPVESVHMSDSLMTLSYRITQED